MENFSTFESIESVHKQLISISKNANIIDDIRRCLLSWNYKSTYSITSLKENIQQVTEELIDLFFAGNNDRGACIFDPIRTLVHSEIYDTLFFRIKERLAKDDLGVYNISKEFCKTDGTPKQLGSTFYNFIPNAAVVELSMINNKRTPMEKLKCLQLAYDYIFAEVKGALITVISKYSEKEIDIPSINNNEVVPIVMSVILKSKLFYFVSDMSYIMEFGTDYLNTSTDLREVFHVFEESLNKILILSSISNEMKTKKLENKLSVCDTINFIESINKENPNKRSVLNEERHRVARLITSATTEDLENYV